MVLAHAMWIHGHSMQIESPENINTVGRKGFSIIVNGKGGMSSWFHFAIPTPVIVNDNRLRVGSVLVRFKTTDATVKAIHVYDGENKIAFNDKLNLSSGQWHVERVDVPNNPEILWGLGISVLVAFGVEASRAIEFSSAGCDFIS